MALKKNTRPRPHSAGRGVAAPLPHPSWRLAPAQGRLTHTPIADAGEFWSRLGL